MLKPYNIRTGSFSILVQIIIVHDHDLFIVPLKRADVTQLVPVDILFLTPQLNWKFRKIILWNYFAY